MGWVRRPSRRWCSSGLLTEVVARTTSVLEERGLGGRSLRSRAPRRTVLVGES